MLLVSRNRNGSVGWEKRKINKTGGNYSGSTVFTRGLEQWVPNSVGQLDSVGVLWELLENITEIVTCM